MHQLIPSIRQKDDNWQENSQKRIYILHKMKFIELYEQAKNKYVKTGVL